MSQSEMDMRLEPALIKRINEDLMPLVRVAVIETLGIGAGLPSVVFDEKAPELLTASKLPGQAAVPLEFSQSESTGFVTDTITINPSEIKKLTGQVMANLGGRAADVDVTRRVDCSVALYLATRATVSQFLESGTAEDKILEIYRRAVVLWDNSGKPR